MWRTKLAELKLFLVSLAAALLLFACFSLSLRVSAQPEPPLSSKLALMFLVDESSSLTAGSEEYENRLYNSVRFMLEAVHQTCLEPPCEVGVMRFSGTPTELVELRDTAHWRPQDYEHLQDRPLDFVDQSDFSTALRQACDAAQKTYAESTALVLLTDGRLSDTTNPEVAPVGRVREQPVSREDFIEDINTAVDDCSAGNTRLFVLFIEPGQVEGESSEQLDAGSGSESESQAEAVREEDQNLWQSWADKTLGALHTSTQPDQPDSISALLASMSARLPLTMPMYLSQQTTIPLGTVPQRRAHAEFQLVGLKPYRVDFVGPDGKIIAPDKSEQATNRIVLIQSLPAAGEWAAQIGETAIDNLFLIPSVVTEPISLRPRVVKQADEFLGITDMGLELIVETRIEDIDRPILLEDTALSARLYLPEGNSLPISLTADTSLGAYVAKLPQLGSKPPAGLYVVVGGVQAIGDVLVRPLDDYFLITYDPFIAGWSIDADQPLKHEQLVKGTVEIENHQVLSGLPMFQIHWRYPGGESTEDAQQGEAIEGGSYQVSLLPPVVGKSLEVWVELLGDETKPGKPFQPTSSTHQLVEVRPSTPPPTPTLPPPAPVPTPKPPWITWIERLGQTNVSASSLILIIIAVMVAVVGLFVLIKAFPYAAILFPLIGPRAVDDAATETEQLDRLEGFERIKNRATRAKRIPLLGLAYSRAVNRLGEDYKEARKSFANNPNNKLDKPELDVPGRKELFKRMIVDARDDLDEWWHWQDKFLDSGGDLRSIAAEEFNECWEAQAFSSPFELSAEAVKNGRIRQYSDHWNNQDTDRTSQLEEIGGNESPSGRLPSATPDPTPPADGS